jgi:secretory phospholipase A2
MTFFLVVLLLSAFLAICGAAKSSEFNEKFNKSCPNFSCSKGLTPVPKPRVTFESAGCGAMGSGKISFKATEVDGEEKPFASCCHQWHACYQICGSSKSVCDETFKKCAEKICGDDEECTKLAKLQSMMVTFAGCPKFDKSQKDACECVDSNNAPTKKEDLIRTFYETYAPENVEKSSDLAMKADSSDKMAELFRELVEKHPSCIKKLEDPQKVKYDKMMKEKKDAAGDNVDKDKVDERVEL